MLRNPKSILLAITNWIDEEYGEESSLQTEDGSSSLTLSPLLEMWQGWERAGVLPASGGWIDQPLPLLVHFNALSLVSSTWNYYRSEEFSWNKLTATQTDLIIWLEKD